MVTQQIAKGNPASKISYPKTLTPIGPDMRAIQDPISDNIRERPSATLIPNFSITITAGMNNKKYKKFSKYTRKVNVALYSSLNQSFILSAALMENAVRANIPSIKNL